MSKSKHTPGPWQIGRDDEPGMEWNNHILAADPELRICFMAHDRTKENESGEANARLIAAAPDLLAAAQEVVESIVSTTHTDLPPTLSSIERLHATIAKATGVIT